RKRQVGDRIGLATYKLAVSGHGSLVGELDPFELGVNPLPDFAQQALREGLHSEGAAILRAAVDHRSDSSAQHEVPGHDRGPGGAFEFDRPGSFELELVLGAL